jgi:hypothetical protein
MIPYHVEQAKHYTMEVAMMNFFFDIRILIFLFEICKLFFYLGRYLEFDLFPRIIGRCYL